MPTGKNNEAGPQAGVVRSVFDREDDVKRAVDDRHPDDERRAYRITLTQPDGTQREEIPFALADLNDNDNNHGLCLNVKDTPIQVSFKAGLLVDPAGDLNPFTQVHVTGQKP